MLLVDIKKKLGDFRLDVQFETEAGPLALLGASGSGKSVTLRCIAGIERPDSGRIVLNGRVLFDRECQIDLPPQRRRVGYLFQQYALFPHMTAAQNIAAGAHALPRDARRETVNRMIRTLRLEGLEDHYPHQLSGGQQQRLALARILAGRPEVLLLDEPFAALDSYLKEQMELELLDTLGSYAGDVVYVSHDRDEACRLCRSVCVLTAGRSEPPRSVGELMTDPGTVGAAMLAGCNNFSRARREDSRTVRCEDWGVDLSAASEVPDDISAVGIHACHILPGSGQGNTIPCTVSRVMESPFVLTVLLTTPGGGLLRMEVDRENWASLGAPDRLDIHVDPQRVMLLKGELPCGT